MQFQIQQIKNHFKDTPKYWVLFQAPQNLFWMLNIPASAGRIIINETGEIHVFMDMRYYGIVKARYPEINLHHFQDFTKKCKELNITTFHIEQDYMTVGVHNHLSKEFKTIPFVSSSLRRIKSDNELRKLQRAADVTVKTFDIIRKWIKPGVTEKAVAKQITLTLLENGADRNSFEPIVASGENGAYPHHRHSERVIKNGEFVTLDFGCEVDGYASDMTRTILVGNQPVGEKAEKVAQYYELVRQAQSLGIQGVKEGVMTKDVDGFCRNFLRDKGYEFGHGTGHGLGIDVHEQPVISPIDTNILAKGDVITIEPGIYVDGIGGVRIEDDVYVTETGHIVLTAGAIK